MESCDGINMNNVKTPCIPTKKSPPCSTTDIQSRHKEVNLAVAGGEHARRVSLAEHFLSNNDLHSKSLWGFSNLPSAIRLDAGESFLEQRQKNEQSHRQKQAKSRFSLSRNLELASSSSVKLGTDDTIESLYENDKAAQEFQSTIEAAADAENERIDTVIKAESAGLKLTPAGEYISPNLCELFFARLLHEHDILELYYVNDRWLTRVHRSIILLARVAIKVTVVGTFFIVKETSNGFWDQVLAISLGFIANKIWGGFIKTLLVLLTSRQRQMALNRYIGESLNARKNPRRGFQHERRELQRRIIRLEIETELQNERHWCVSAIFSCFGCNARRCRHLPSQTVICMDLAAFCVWLIVFAMIGFCLFFGVMFGFAIEDSSMTTAWLESVLFSIAFWIFCSRPAIIFIKSFLQKGKLMRTAATVHSRRKDQAKRRLTLLESLGNKHQSHIHTSGAECVPQSEIEMTLSEMIHHENKLYEHYSSDIVSPPKIAKGDESFLRTESVVTL